MNLTFNSHRIQVALHWRIQEYNKTQIRNALKVHQKAFLTGENLYNLYSSYEKRNKELNGITCKSLYQIDYSLSELATQFKCGNQTIKSHINKLETAGLLIENLRYGYQYYTATLDPSISLLYPSKEYHTFYKLCLSREKELKKLGYPQLSLLFDHLNS